jgi:hypothetical protein
MMLGSAIAGAQQQRQQGVYDRGVAEYNARVQENEAEKVTQAGTEAENAQREKTEQLISTQRAQLAAGNIDVSSGTPLHLQEDTVALGEADALRIRSNYIDRADALRQRAQMTRAGGAMAESAGKQAAFGSLLQGAGGFIGQGVSSKWFSSSSAANTGGPAIA